MTEREREQFEAAMSAYCDPKNIEETFYRDGEYYQAYATMFAWEAWQAARATPADHNNYPGLVQGEKVYEKDRATPADDIVDANKKVDAPTLNKLMWSDMSTASPIEKARRVLDHLAKQDSAYFFEDGFPRSVMMSDVRACIAVLNHLTPQPEAQSVRDAWISVDERLPNPALDVLVQCVGGSPYLYGTKPHFDVAALYDSQWQSAVTQMPCEGKVTHWKPLSAPPQKPVSDET